MSSSGSGARSGSAVRGGRGGATPPKGGATPPFFARSSPQERTIDAHLEAQAKAKAEAQPKASPEGAQI